MNDIISLIMTKNEEITKKNNKEKTNGNKKLTNNFQIKENSIKSVNTTILEEDSQINKSLSSNSKGNNDNEDDDDDEALPDIEVLKIKPFEKNLDICKENIIFINQEQESLKHSENIKKINVDSNFIENKQKTMHLEQKKLEENNVGDKNSLKEGETMKKKSKIKKEDLMKIIMQLNEVSKYKKN